MDQIQLRLGCRSRHWSRYLRNRHLLLHHVPRCIVPGLVGQYRMAEYKRWISDTVEGITGEGFLWAGEWMELRERDGTCYRGSKGEALWLCC